MRTSSPLLSLRRRLSPDPTPARSARLASVVVAVGFVAAILAVTFYRAFELDRFFVPKEAVLHATAFVAGLLVVGRVRRLQMTWVDLALIGFLFASIASAALATNTWAGGRALAITVSGAVLFWVGRVLRDEGLGDMVLRAAAVAVVLAAVTALLQAYGVTSDFFSANRSPGGTLGNRNFVGHLAAFGLPLVLWPVLRAHGWRGTLLSIASVALVVGILVLTRSRAAWLGMGAVVGVIALGLMLAPALRRRAVAVRLVLLLAVAAGGGALAIAVPNALEWRSDAPYLETAQGVLNYREGSGQGRLVQYRQSLTLTLGAPVLGVGPGNWSVAYPGVAPAGDPSLSGSRAGMTSNPWPSSDAIALVSERGLAGTVLWVLFAVGLLGAAWRAAQHETDPDTAAGAVVLLAMCAGVAVTGLFDAVLLLSWPTLLVVTAAGVLFPAERMRALAVPKWVPMVVILVLALLSGAGTMRSAGQWAAMSIYATDGSRAALERAARLDPGNYRVHLKLAQRSRGAAQRCPPAQAAAALYPHAEAARRLAARCR